MPGPLSIQEATTEYKRLTQLISHLPPTTWPEEAKDFFTQLARVLPYVCFETKEGIVSEDLVDLTNRIAIFSYWNVFKSQDLKSTAERPPLCIFYSYWNRVKFSEEFVLKLFSHLEIADSEKKAHAMIVLTVLLNNVWRDESPIHSLKLIEIICSNHERFVDFSHYQYTDIFLTRLLSSFKCNFLDDENAEAEFLKFVKFLRALFSCGFPFSISVIEAQLTKQTSPFLYRLFKEFDLLSTPGIVARRLHWTYESCEEYVSARRLPSEALERDRIGSIEKFVRETRDQGVKSKQLSDICRFPEVLVSLICDYTGIEQKEYDRIHFLYVLHVYCEKNFVIKYCSGFRPGRIRKIERVRYSAKPDQEIKVTSEDAEVQPCQLLSEEFPRFSKMQLYRAYCLELASFYLRPFERPRILKREGSAYFREGLTPEEANSYVEIALEHLRACDEEYLKRLSYSKFHLLSLKMAGYSSEAKLRIQSKFKKCLGEFINGCLITDPRLEKFPMESKALNYQVTFWDESRIMREVKEEFSLLDRLKKIAPQLEWKIGSEGKISTSITGESLKQEIIQNLKKACPDLTLSATATISSSDQSLNTYSITVSAIPPVPVSKS